MRLVLCRHALSIEHNWSKPNRLYTLGLKLGVGEGGGLADISRLLHNNYHLPNIIS